MTSLGLTYAILKAKPPRSLFRTHALAYFGRRRPTLAAGRDPWVLLHL